MDVPAVTGISPGELAGATGHEQAFISTLKSSTGGLIHALLEWRSQSLYNHPNGLRLPGPRPPVELALDVEF
jgi:hypothetical protein